MKRIISNYIQQNPFDAGTIWGLILGGVFLTLFFLLTAIHQGPALFLR